MSQYPENSASPVDEPVYQATIVSPQDAQFLNEEPVIHLISGRPIERLTRAKEIIGKQYWAMLGFCLLGVLVGSLLPLGVLMGPVFCGLHICYHECRQNRPVAMDHLVKGADYFGDSLIAMLIMVLVSTMVTIPLFLTAIVMFIIGMSMVEQGGPAAILFIASAMFYVFGLVASVLAHVPFVFTFPLIVDRKMSGVEAVKLSAKAAWKNFPAVTWFMVGNMLTSFFAALFCYVPAILLMPMNFGATFELYYEVFDTGDKEPVVSIPVQ